MNSNPVITRSTNEIKEASYAHQHPQKNKNHPICSSLFVGVITIRLHTHTHTMYESPDKPQEEKAVTSRLDPTLKTFPLKTETKFQLPTIHGHPCFHVIRSNIHHSFMYGWTKNSIVSIPQLGQQPLFVNIEKNGLYLPCDEEASSSNAFVLEYTDNIHSMLVYSCDGYHRSSIDTETGKRGHIIPFKHAVEMKTSVAWGSNWFNLSCRPSLPVEERVLSYFSDHHELLRSISCPVPGGQILLCSPRKDFPNESAVASGYTTLHFVSLRTRLAHLSFTPEQNLQKTNEETELLVGTIKISASENAEIKFSSLSSPPWNQVQRIWSLDISPDHHHLSLLASHSTMGTHPHIIHLSSNPLSSSVISLSSPESTLSSLMWIDDNKLVGLVPPRKDSPDQSIPNTGSHLISIEI